MCWVKMFWMFLIRCFGTSLQHNLSVECFVASPADTIAKLEHKTSQRGNVKSCEGDERQRMHSAGDIDVAEELLISVPSRPSVFLSAFLRSGSFCILSRL